jgi:hypothetical protein
MPTYISGLICCGVPPVQTNPIWNARRSPLSRTSPPFSNRGVSESNPRWRASRTPSHRRRSCRAIQGLQVTGARRARGPLAPDQHPLGCCMERRRPNGAPPSTSSTPPAPPPGQWQWYAHIPPCFGSVQFFTRFPSYTRIKISSNTCFDNFCTSVSLLDLVHYDFVLGMDWLGSHSPM